MSFAQKLDIYKINNFWKFGKNWCCDMIYDVISMSDFRPKNAYVINYYNLSFSIKNRNVKEKMSGQPLPGYN